ncbi:DUF742 domain-containing protein [Streptomyces sp. NPDC004237]|uniref:DUF742 domain-containing protein n=1 Tax=unclassified Streptomyces TaxID=2593676 RepID=UPI0033A0D019
MRGADDARRSRLFALTPAQAARAPAEGEPLSMHSLVAATPWATHSVGLPEEWQAALALCADAPRAVAELAARLRLPLSTVIAMLTELAARGLLHHQPPLTEDQAADVTLLHRIRRGLQAL